MESKIWMVFQYRSRRCIQRGGICSLLLDENLPAHDIALLLDEVSGVMVRSGQHCVHSWFNDRGYNGSLRASAYFYNTEEDVNVLSIRFQKQFRHFSEGTVVTGNHDTGAKDEGLSPQLEKDLEIVRRIVSRCHCSTHLGSRLCLQYHCRRWTDIRQPSDALIESEQTYRELISLPSGYSGSGVNVCIVDTGMELNHPDLEGFDVAGGLILFKVNPIHTTIMGMEQTWQGSSCKWLDQRNRKRREPLCCQSIVANGSGYKKTSLQASIGALVKT